MSFIGDIFVNRKLRIEKIIIKSINPSLISVKDVSEEHRGHNSFKEGIESHFDIMLVSEKFSNKSKIQRHRIVNEILKEEFLSDLHSVTLKLYSIEEYNKN